MDKPPIIAPPRRNTAARLLKKALLIVVAGFFFVGFMGFLAMPRPPKESKLLQDFYAHRTAFEQLRDMLQAEPHLRRIEDWGVDAPSTNIVAPERYHRYLALLKQTGGQLASRNQGQHADPSILLWGWGWAGNSKQLGICWLDESPTNQISSIDHYHGSHYPNRVVAFRHIDEKWYLWTDL